MKKRAKKSISCFLVMIIIISNSSVFADSLLSDKQTQIHFTSEEGTFYEELVEFEGVLTYFYQNRKNNDVIVITKSQIAGIDAYYNNGQEVFQIDNLIDQDFQSLSEITYFKNLKDQIIEDFKKENAKTLKPQTYYNEQELFQSNISPYGITSSKQYFIKQTGKAYYDKIVASKTIKNKYVVIYENKTHNIYEVNRLAIAAGKGLGVLLAFLTMPKSVAITLGIVTFIKDGIEYLKNPYTILKYNASLTYKKDVTVNGLTTHEVQKKNVYDLWENNTKHSLNFKFSGQDEHFGDNAKLMQIGVNKY